MTIRPVVFMFILAIAVLAGAQDAAEAPARPVAFNEAEAVLEVFWQPEFSGFPEWEVDDGSGHRLHTAQNWAAVEFQWETRPETGPALRMRRAFNVDCSDYDRVLLAMTPPGGAVVRMRVDTDRGERLFVSEPAAGDAVEYALDLDGATRVLGMAIEIEAREDGPAAGWFKWIALQHGGLLERYHRRWDFSHLRWEPHLVPEGEFAPAFEPRYGIFFDEAELESLRASHEKHLRETGDSPFLQAAAGLRGRHPESAISEFANSGGRRNYPDGRARDADRPSFSGGVQAARLGLILRDPDLVRLAARTALSMAVCERWHEGFTANYPGSSWELRSFRRSYVAQDIATIFDLAGEAFTEEGRRFLLRRLSEEGVGPINYVVWRYDYVHECNQLSYFSLGRVAAYLVLEREWPRVKPYTTLAATELQQLFDTQIMSDGGFMEPPTYFQGTFRLACDSLELYARGRGLAPEEVVPESLARTGDYAAVIASTRPDADVIPLGDSGENFSLGFLLRLARACPGSYWVTMARKRLERQEALADDDRLATAGIAEEGPPAPAFVFLPDTGHMASVRMLGEHAVKIFIPGNRGAGPHSHQHEDKGSFVLEFAGEAFAIDPGIGSYSDPLHNLRKQCEYHNMLVPTGTPERPRPLFEIPVDVKPAGRGDAVGFEARLDVTPGWEAYFARWVRSWNSPGPDVLIIRDEYELTEGDGVAFYWQTRLPCEVDGRTVSIRGERGTVVIAAPEDAELQVDTLPGMAEAGAQRRIAIRKPGRAGALEVTARLLPRDDG